MRTYIHSCVFSVAALAAQGALGDPVTGQEIFLRDGSSIELHADGTYTTHTPDARIQVEYLGGTDVSEQEYNCKANFRVTNGGFGSLSRFAASLNFVDDRGRKLDCHGFCDLELFSYSEGKLAVGHSLETDVSVVDECSYIDRIEFSLRDSNCNMRMRPERVTCRDITDLSSSAKNVTFE